MVMRNRRIRLLMLAVFVALTFVLYSRSDPTTIEGARKYAQQKASQAYHQALGKAKGDPSSGQGDDSNGPAIEVKKDEPFRVDFGAYSKAAAANNPEETAPVNIPPPAAPVPLPPAEPKENKAAVPAVPDKKEDPMRVDFAAYSKAAAVDPEETAPVTGGKNEAVPGGKSEVIANPHPMAGHGPDTPPAPPKEPEKPKAKTPEKVEKDAAPPKDQGRIEVDVTAATGEAVHWVKRAEKFPISSTKMFPHAEATPIPKIQYDFKKAGGPAADSEKLAVIKAAALHSWSGYKEKAMGHDEVKPVSGKFANPFNAWGATLVDSLDTLWMMGMIPEFEEALEWVAKIDFTTSRRADIPVFETTIRYLGGLLGAFEISSRKYQVLLTQASQLGEILYGAFDTPNRMPLTYYRWKPASTDEAHRAQKRTILAELGSLSLEFSRLGQLTASMKYYDAVARITDALEEWQSETRIPGLWPTTVDASGCKRKSTSTKADSKVDTKPAAKADDSVPIKAGSESGSTGSAIGGKEPGLGKISGFGQPLAEGSLDNPSVKDTILQAPGKILKRALDTLGLEMGDPLTSELTSTGSAGKTQSDTLTDAALSGAEKVKDAALSGAEKVKDSALSVAEKVKDSALSGAEKVKDTALSGAEKAKDAALSGAEKVKDSALSGAEKAKDSALSGAEKVKDSALSGVEKSESRTATAQTPLLDDDECTPQGLTSTSEYASDVFSLGAAADSTYEYLPKMHMLFGGRTPQYEKMYKKAIEAAKKHLIFRPMIPDENRELLFSGNVDTPPGGDNGDYSRDFKPVMSHLTCFVGGMFAMGGKIFGNPEDVEYGAKLTDGCVWAYNSTTLGMMPEVFGLVKCDSKTSCKWDQKAYYHAIDPWESNRLAGTKPKTADPRAMKKPEADKDTLVKRQFGGGEMQYGVQTSPGTIPVEAAAQFAEVPTRDMGHSGFAGSTTPDTVKAPFDDGAASKIPSDTKAVPASVNGAPYPGHDTKEKPLSAPATDAAPPKDKLPPVLPDTKIAPTIGDIKPDASFSENKIAHHVPDTGLAPTVGDVDKKSSSGSSLSDKSLPETVPAAIGSLHKVPYPNTKSSETESLPHEEYVKEKIKNSKLPAGMTDMYSKEYLLRPEAIESVFYMYRITGNQYWRDRGWEMWQAISKHTAAKYGASAIEDITKAVPELQDSEESFWLAETLKYFYLLFDDPDRYSLDDWILNTEAHFFARLGA